MEFVVYVSYSQIAVFRSDLENPFNDWSDRHVAQGFAWRPGSVSFSTLMESGMHVVCVEVVDAPGALDEAAVRAVEVPFDVPESGAVEISSIEDAQPLSLTPGSYLLRCETLLPGEDGSGRVRFKFSKQEKPRFAVLRMDSGFSAGDELLATAEPA